MGRGKQQRSGLLRTATGIRGARPGFAAGNGTFYLDGALIQQRNQGPDGSKYRSGYRANNSRREGKLRNHSVSLFDDDPASIAFMDDLLQTFE